MTQRPKVGSLFQRGGNDDSIDTAGSLAPKGINREVWSAYRLAKGISGLHEWQKRVIDDDSFLSGKNLLLSVSTGAGKTLIADLAVLDYITRTGNCAIVVVPFVSLAVENVNKLVLICESLAIDVQLLAGNVGQFPVRPLRRTLFVATIEKAASLINIVIENPALTKIGVVVVDEIHMLCEGMRGARLENLILLARAKFECQFIALSATIQNADEVAAFLGAKMMGIDFVAVPRVDYRVDGLEVCKMDGTPVTQLKPADSKDILGVVALTVSSNDPTLIFSPARQMCEDTALHVARHMQRIPGFADMDLTERAYFSEAYETLKQTPVLLQLVAHRVAYHHGALLPEERTIIEEGFRLKYITVISCTSTLSTGVNLPVRRVIIRTAKFGQPFTRTVYLQMIGRAGRAGLDKEGVSYVFGLKDKKLEEVLEEKLPYCESQLLLTLHDCLINLIGVGYTTKTSVHQILRSSFWGLQRKEVDSEVDSALGEMVAEGLCTVDENEHYVLTSLGSGAFRSSIHVLELPELVTRLFKFSKTGVSLATIFPLLFMCMPMDLVLPKIDWNVFERYFNRLGDNEKKFLEVPNPAKHFLDSDMRKSVPTLNDKQFYAALALYRLLSTGLWSLRETAAIFFLPSDSLQSIYDSVYYRMSSIIRVAENVSVLWPYRALLPEVLSFMRTSTDPTIRELTLLDCVTETIAKSMLRKGISTAETVSKMLVADLVRAIKVRPVVAQSIISSAKASVSATAFQ